MPLYKIMICKKTNYFLGKRQHTGLEVLRYIESIKMIKFLNPSEASSIALHAASYIAAAEEKVSAVQIAKEIGASPHHLSKILRRLVVSDCISVEKGPKGGFFIKPKQRKKTFMDVFMAIEGGAKAEYCSRLQGPCGRGLCIFGDLLKDVNAMIEKYFKTTHLDGKVGWPSLMNKTNQKSDDAKKKNCQLKVACGACLIKQQ